MVFSLIRVIIAYYCTALVFSVFLFVVTVSRKSRTVTRPDLSTHAQKNNFLCLWPFLFSRAQFPFSGHHQLVMRMEGKDTVYFISASLEKLVFLANSSNTLYCQWVFGSQGIQSRVQAILQLRDIKQVLEENNTGPIWSVFEKISVVPALFGPSVHDVASAHIWLSLKFFGSGQFAVFFLQN